ncbi:HD domain-containing protein [Nocardia transvalensis]|uniref:HD domain-containing protein n=1 Tax=Nocardia transvalensis TaxID=37333 RepID=UPI0018956995|nr:HD domain-containing protein [Nocardia transvalensis]MBF6327338.1 HD domain-containing protein [Nocardia transvalensis]
MATVSAEMVEAVRDGVADRFGSDLVAHDLAHLDRVARLARRIAREEGQDEVLPQLIAYVHDFHRIAEQELGRPVASEEVLPRIRKFLYDSEIPEPVIDEVERAVIFNERYLIKGDSLGGGSSAARIVRDADKLDAMGAIGIARAFMFGGAHRAPLWDPEAERMATYRSGPTSSVIAHFYEKLVRLPQEMLTDTGRRLAGERAAFLVEYLRRFHEEWGDSETAPVNELDTQR